MVQKLNKILENQTYKFGIWLLVFMIGFSSLGAYLNMGISEIMDLITFMIERDFVIMENNIVKQYNKCIRKNWGDIHSVDIDLAFSDYKKLQSLKNQEARSAKLAPYIEEIKKQIASGNIKLN